jgi:chromosome segregation ATPase
MASETALSWSDIRKPEQHEPGYEWYVQAINEVKVLKAAAEEIKALRDQRNALADQRKQLAENVALARTERDVLQEIVDEQRSQIAKLVERIVELTEEVSSVTEDRRHAVAALSEELDTLRAKHAEMQRMVCRALYTDELMQRNHAKVCGWRCFEVTP